MCFKGSFLPAGWCFITFKPEAESVNSTNISYPFIFVVFYFSPKNLCVNLFQYIDISFVDKEHVFWFFFSKLHLRCCDSGFILFCLVSKLPYHRVGWVLLLCFILVFWFSSGYRKVL
jgi:hypothetical protein